MHVSADRLTPGATSKISERKVQVKPITKATSTGILYYHNGRDAVKANGAALQYELDGGKVTLLLEAG